jgi:putative ABC transport system ATP-binding protein
MVTHDPVAASYSQRVVFLADGRLVSALDAPTPLAILDQMRALGEPQLRGPGLGQAGQSGA